MMAFFAPVRENMTLVKQCKMLEEKLSNNMKAHFYLDNIYISTFDIWYYRVFYLQMPEGKFKSFLFSHNISQDFIFVLLQIIYYRHDIKHYIYGYLKFGFSVILTEEYNNTLMIKYIMPVHRTSCMPIHIPNKC